MDFCAIASGSSGNCTYVGTSRGGLLVDAGISGKRITAGLAGIDRKPEELEGILITHEHSDHIQGIGVLARRYHIPIYATSGTWCAIKTMKSIGQIDPALFHCIREDEPFMVGDIKVSPFKISHDAAQPVGYRMEADGKKFAIATDMGCYDDYIIEHLKGLDAMILEANHDVNMLEVGPYPYPLKRRILGERGHLSNVLAGQLLCEILHDDIKEIQLGHLSKENNYAALALATVHSEITMGDVPYRGDDFSICVAKRDEPTGMVEL